MSISTIYLADFRMYKTKILLNKFPDTNVSIVNVVVKHEFNHFFFLLSMELNICAQRNRHIYQRRICTLPCWCRLSSHKKKNGKKGSFDWMHLLCIIFMLRSHRPRFYFLFFECILNGRNDMRNAYASWIASHKMKNIEISLICVQRWIYEFQWMLRANATTAYKWNNRNAERRREKRWAERKKKSFPII